MEYFTRPWTWSDTLEWCMQWKRDVLKNLVYIKLTASSDCQSLKWYRSQTNMGERPNPCNFQNIIIIILYCHNSL